MTRVLAVNNYPTLERFEKLRNSLQDNGAKVTAIGWKDASAAKFNKFDGVALSGSPDMLSKPTVQKKYKGEIDAITDAKVPILGVCYGHQLIGLAFGSRVVEDRQHVLDFVRTRILADSPLFSGLSRSTMLLESRHEVVQALPPGFELLARSETSQIAAMKHRTLPIYGIQSHPERYSSENPDGFKVMGNFVHSIG